MPDDAPPPALLDDGVLGLTPKDAARALGVSRSYLYELLAQGRLKGFKVGTRTIVSRESLLAFWQTLTPYEREAS